MQKLKLIKDFAYVSTNASFNVLNISNPDSGTIEFTKNNTEFRTPLFGLLAVSNGNILLGIDYFGVIILKNVINHKCRNAQLYIHQVLNCSKIFLILLILQQK